MATGPAEAAAGLQKMAQLLGKEGIFADAATLGRYARTTQPGEERLVPRAVVYPDCVAQVQEIVGIASAHQLALYPISCGKNWGYGDATAPTANQIIVDFKRMNRIVEVNEELAYCVIEPGVTQGQLYRYLQEKHPGLWMDCTGAGLQSSFVGNTLDRGFGHTRYGDHFTTTCSMEVVLADGRILRTGYGHYENAQATRAYRYGVGPFLDGLFTQSSMGIVTQIGMWLMPAPEDFCSFFFAGEKHEDLRVLVDRLAPLRMQGLLQSAIHIGNDLRTMSARRRYPWEMTGGKTPLPAEVRARLRKEIGVGAWNGCGAMYGSRDLIKATKKELKKAIGGYRLTFLDERKFATAHRVRRMLGWVGKGQKLEELLKVVEPVYGLLKGVPSDEPLRGAGWRVRPPPSISPSSSATGSSSADSLDNHVGLMWVSPVLPTTGGHAMELMGIMEPIYAKHGFEALVTFTMITERAMCCVTNVAFDKREAAEAERAVACYEKLTAAVVAAGYIPYRTGHRGYEKLGKNSRVFWDVVGEIKKALDPGNISSPGRYEVGGR